MRRFYASHGHWHAKRQGKIMNEIRSASGPSIKKAVIYARFSTDLQNERSIEDQITLCRSYASREGIEIIEALDRLSRDMEDLAGIHKRLSFLGIEIRAVREVQPRLCSLRLRGLVGQLYREDNAHKV